MHTNNLLKNGNNNNTKRKQRVKATRRNDRLQTLTKESYLQNKKIKVHAKTV